MHTGGEIVRSVGGPAVLSGPGGHGQPDGVLALAFRYLRGRVLWVVILALLLGSAGSSVGWRLGEKLYTSRGMIAVAPVLAGISSDAGSVMPMYETFADKQVALIKSQRVIEFAMTSEDWLKLGRNASADSIIQFTADLKVSRRGEVIYVELTDPDPNGAMAGVTAVVNAYKKLYVEQGEAQSTEAQIKLLTDWRAKWSTELAGYEAKVREIAVRHEGTQDLSLPYNRKLAEVVERQRDIKAMEQAIGSMGTTGATTQPVGELTVDEIAWEDQRMAALVEARDQWQRTLEVMRGKLGDGSDRRIAAEAELKIAIHKIDDYARVYRQRLKEKRQALLGGAASKEQLGERLASLKREQEADTARLRKVVEDQNAISEWKEKAKRAESQVEETRQRIERLRIETQAGRISAFGSAERPLEPSKDSRLMRAGVGGIGGIGLGVGLVLLIGVSDRRLRFPEDAPITIGGDVALGVLPVIPNSTIDPEGAAMAARCVHRIRTGLQISHGGDGPTAYTVTSPAAGTGKTSLTFALGMSFASSGSKTLLIDCDMVGGGAELAVHCKCPPANGQAARRTGTGYRRAVPRRPEARASDWTPAGRRAG
jgi:polysaccharide biosynthesis transport protein